MLDLVISKSFLRNKLKIKFNVTNILKEAGAVEIKHNDRKYVSYE